MLILHNSLVIKIYINILFSISDFSLFSSYHFFILHFFTIRLILGLYCLFFIPFFYKFYYFILIYCIYFFLVYILFHFILHLILLNILLHLLNKCNNIFRSEEHTSELQSRSDLVCRL